MSDEEIGEDVRSVLTEGERILAAARQNAIHSPLLKDLAVVTNRRLILYRPKLLGRMEMEDFLWQDVTEVRVHTKVLGATLSVAALRRQPDGTTQSRSGSIDGLDKSAALRLYAQAQQLEEQWREKNRLRQMEEERARSGGVHIQGAGAAGASGVEERLAKLRSLHEKGLISDAEYESRKSQIIAEL